MSLTPSYQVCYYEAGAPGCLFNGRFLETADVSMPETFRAMCWAHAELNELGMDPSVVSALLTFVSPARLDGVPGDVAVSSHMGRPSSRLHMLFERAETSIATVERTYIDGDTPAARARPILKSPPPSCVGGSTTPRPRPRRHPFRLSERSPQ